MVRSSLCFSALSVSALLMADCDVPLGKYTANWIGHTDAYSAKKLSSATTELVIRETESGDNLIFDWFLKLEPNDDKQEIYDLGNNGTVTCDGNDLTLEISTFRDEAYNQASWLTFWMYNIKDIFLKKEGTKKSTPLTFSYETSTKELTSTTLEATFDFYHRAKSRHIYLKQKPEQPFVLTKRK